MAFKKDKFALEAARAAVLATHAAAGLATGTSSREVIRLLRSAEALARSAVALLSTPPTTSSSSGTSSCANGARVVPPAGAGDGTPGANSARRRRRRSKKNKQTKNEKMDVDEACGAQAMTTTRAGTSSLGAGDGTSGLGVPPRRLARHETLPPSPPSSSTSATLSSPTTGSLGTLRGLVARPELNGSHVRFLRVADDVLRYVVEPVDGGDAIRVNPGAFVGNKKAAATPEARR